MTLPRSDVHFPLLAELGCFWINLPISGKDWAPGDFEQHVTKSFFLLTAPQPRGSEDGWNRAALPLKVASPPPLYFPRHSVLFLKCSKPFVCYWTFSLLVSLLAQLTPSPERALGAGRGNLSGMSLHCSAAQSLSLGKSPPSLLNRKC